MSAPTTEIYRGHAESVAGLARSLIVASCVHSGPEPFSLPMTAENARYLGRTLEWALALSAGHEALVRGVQAREESVEAFHRAAVAEAEKAMATYARAKRSFWQSLALHVGAMVWFTASLVFWWLA